MTSFYLRIAGVALATCLLATVAARGASFSVMYEFRGDNDGAFPSASLINAGGTLYGTTGAGGADYFGTTFSVVPRGTEQVVYSFQGANDGQDPMAGLIVVNGMLYGTTCFGGGSNNFGTVFSGTTTGAESVLYAFKGGADGANPFGALIDVGGTFYGTTSAGGANGNGTVFSVTRAGAETVLYSFRGGGDGAAPQAGLIEVGGNLYGTTSAGGAYDAGTVFSVTRKGAESVLYVFHGGNDSGDGVAPFGSLVKVGGKLYGTTRAGGANDAGTVFSVTTTGKERVVYSFARGAVDGAVPSSGLVDVGGTLYGTTYVGGTVTNCSGIGCGTVFSVTTKGVEKVLHSFGGSDGAFVYAGLLNVNGTLYGTTVGGGSGHCAIGIITGCGLVFAVTP